ncbi:hypothetical protein [Enterococcus sp. AZ180]|uniref:hypothetical protein n=1 Tax=Enterococcus sp. AZ180 TaxID=2774961 RepID=UPI003F21AC1F
MAKGGLNGFLSNFKSSSGEKIGKEEPKDKIPPKPKSSQPAKEVAKTATAPASAKEAKSSPKPVKLKLNVNAPSKAEDIKKPDNLDDDLFNIIDSVKEENKEIVEKRKYARVNKQSKVQAKSTAASQAKVSAKPAKASSEDDAGPLAPETIDRLFKASETPPEHRDKWIDAYVKANKSPKNNAMSRKVREGRFRFKEKDGLLEILPEFSSYKMNDREILRGNWLGDQTKKKNKGNK